MAKPQKRGSGEAVNVTELDLGEVVQGAINDEAAKLAGSRGSGKEKPSGSRFSKFSGGYRPGMYGGYRPSSYAPGGRPGLSRPGDWRLGDMLKMPEKIKPVAKDLLTGGLVGTVGNRVVAWVVPGLVKTESKIATDAIAFGVGIAPYLFARNAFTVGIALPGLFFLAGSLAEYALEKTKILGAKPTLSGLPGAQPAASQAAVQARQKLAQVRNRMQQARQGGAQVPRVLARPRVA